MRLTTFDHFTEELHAPLDKYISKLNKVKIIRNTKREGLIRARLNGKFNNLKLITISIYFNNIILT